jgi:hypothetical protein
MLIYSPTAASHGTRAHIVYKPAGGCQSATGDDFLRHIESGIVGIAEYGLMAPNYNDPQNFLTVKTDAIQLSDPAISDAAQFTNKDSEYALVSGDKAVALKYLPPGAFTGLMREFMLAMYCTPNPLMRYQVTADNVGFAESVSISISTGGDNPTYIPLGNTDGNTSAIYVYEDAERLDFYLLTITRAGVTARKFRFGKLGMMLKEMQKVGVFTGGYTSVSAFICMMTDVTGFCPPKSVNYTSSPNEAPPMFYGWHVTNDGKRAEIAHFHIHATLTKASTLTVVSSVNISIDTKGKPTVSTSFPNMSSDGICPFRRSSDLFWVPSGQTRIVAICLNAELPPNANSISENGGSDCNIYVISNGVAFSKVKRSLQYNVRPANSDTGWVGGCYEGIFFGEPRLYCCAAVSNRVSVEYFQNVTQSGTAGLSITVGSGMRKWQYKIMKLGSAGSVFQTISGNASSPQTCEPRNFIPPNTFVARVQWSTWEYSEKVYWEAGTGTTAFLIPLGDCEAYYAFSEQTTTAMTLVFSLKNTFAAADTAIAYGAKEGQCYDADKVLFQYKSPMLYGGAFATGTVTIPNACGGDPLVYTKTSTTDTAEPPVTIRKVVFNMRFGSSQTTISIPTDRIGWVDPFPEAGGFLSLVGSRTNLQATSSVTGYCWEWESGKTFFSTGAQLDPGAWRFTGFQ